MLKRSARELILSPLLTLLARPFAAVRKPQRRKVRWQNSVESLEERCLLAADLTAVFDNGTLTVTDTSVTGTDNSLTIQVIGADLVITDTNSQFQAAPTGGLLSNGSQTLTIPVSLLNVVNVHGGAGADSIFVESLGAAFSADLNLFGDGDADTVIFQTAPIFTNRNINVKADTITVNAAITCAAQMELISDGDDCLLSINAPVLIGGYSEFSSDKMAINATVTVTVGWLKLTPETTADVYDAVMIGATDDSAVDTLELSNEELNRITAEDIIIGQHLTGTITVSGAIEHIADSPFQVQTSRRLVFTSGSSWKTHNGFLGFVGISDQSGAQSYVGLDIDNAHIISTGTGLIQLAGGDLVNNSENVGTWIHNGSVVESTGTGVIQLIAAGSNGLSMKYGVKVEGAGTRVTSVTGDIQIVGHVGYKGVGAADTRNNRIGVYISAGASVSSSGAARIVVEGSIGRDINASSAVVIDGVGTKVTTVNGDIVITGSPSEQTSGAGNRAIEVSGGALIQSTGIGKISLDGMDNTDTDNSRGVEISGPETVITSVTGDITMNGVSDDGNAGIWLHADATVQSTGAANITLQGTGGTAGTGHGIRIEGGVIRTLDGGTGNIQLTGIEGSGSNGISLQNDHSSSILDTSAGTGSITLIANRLEIDTQASTPLVQAGTHTVTIRPRTNDVTIGLGSADSNSTLGLTDTELDRVRASQLIIGSTTSGNMIISADVTRPAATNLQLITGSVLVINGQLNTAGGTLSLQSGASPNVISPTNLNTDVIATTTTLAGPLSLELNGDSAGNEYSQLTVEGGINLNGVQLVLSGSYIPPEDTPFVIVDNDGNDAIVGTFMGLSEGAIVTLNGRSLQLSYSGGTNSNDVVLTTLNAEPLASSINEFTDEDTALNGILPVTDPDSSSFTFHVVTPPSSGVVEITNPATGAYTYTPDQDFNGTVNFSYQVNDGVNNSNIATITIVVAPVNDTPQLDFNGGSTTFSAKAARKNGPFRFSPNLNVYDPDNTPQFKIGGGTLTISIDVAVKVTKRATKQLDTIRGLTAASSLGTTSGPVYANGKLTLQVALNANTSAAAVQNFLRNITFSTKGLGLKQQLRTIKIQATDAAGATSPLLQRTINVTR